MNLVNFFVSFSRKCLKTAADFLYPPFCLHCDSPLGEEVKIFCGSCLEHMALVDPIERCPLCFRTDTESAGTTCAACVRHPPLWQQAASALDYEGPAASMIMAMKYSDQPQLANAAAALMASQFTRLSWPFPDVIVPVPMSFTRWMQRGYNQSELLASTLGKFLGRPVVKALKRRSGDFNQAGLSSTQRMDLKPSSFYLAKGQKIEDRIVLLVDDVMTTGATLRCCAEVLLESFPEQIYILTVCRAIQ